MLISNERLLAGLQESVNGLAASNDQAGRENAAGRGDAGFRLGRDHAEGAASCHGFRHRQPRRGDAIP